MTGASQISRIVRVSARALFGGFLRCSCFFGIVHIGGGLSYVFLASLAGLFYGYSYAQSKRIEVSIFVHFFLRILPMPPPDCP